MTTISRRYAPALLLWPLLLCACTSYHPSTITPAIAPCIPSTPPSPHRLLSEQLLLAAALLDAAASSSPSLAPAHLSAWLQNLTPDAAQTPARALAAEHSWDFPSRSLHDRCDAPPLAVAQHRLDLALSRLRLRHPPAAKACAHTLAQWLSPPHLRH